MRCCLATVRSSRGYACLALLLLMTSGCGPRTLQPKGDAQSAKQALQEGLSAWKAGESIADFSKPPVIINDPDWKAGQTLQAFEITEEPILHGTHWRAIAQITVAPAGQSGVPERVCYAVTLGSPISIVRNDALD